MNIYEFTKLYGTEQKCLDFIAKTRYTCCPKCNGKLYKITNRKSCACRNGHQVAILGGTIFEKSKTKLFFWFYAIYLMTETRCGVSAKFLQRTTGVTYKTAWRMFKQIRILMIQDNEPLDIEVEIDEAYIGGRKRNRLANLYSNTEPKEILWGAVQRNGKVRIKHVANTGKWTLLEAIKKNIKEGTLVNSDELTSYTNIHKYGYPHQFVSHSKYEYARGSVTTNRIENVWSHLKPGLTAVHRQVSKKYLQNYADEFAFRYNNRKRPEEMFDILLNNSAR